MTVVRLCSIAVAREDIMTIKSTTGAARGFRSLFRSRTIGLMILVGLGVDAIVIDSAEAYVAHRGVTVRGRHGGVYHRGATVARPGWHGGGVYHAGGVYHGGVGRWAPGRGRPPIDGGREARSLPARLSDLWAPRQRRRGPDPHRVQTSVGIIPIRAEPRVSGTLAHRRGRASRGWCARAWANDCPCRRGGHAATLRDRPFLRPNPGGSAVCRSSFPPACR